MKKIILVLCATCAVTVGAIGGAFDSITNSSSPAESSVFPKVVGSIHPEAFKSPNLWRAVAKTDPPEEWHKVITPANRDKYPASFTLRVWTNGPTATFYFTFSPTNHLVMFKHMELFEPDPDTLNSPRAEKGLVSIKLDSYSTKGSNTVFHSASFTYPTNRLRNAYLRVHAFTQQLWPISLDAFLKTPDPEDLPVDEGTDVNKDVKIDISF